MANVESYDGKSVPEALADMDKRLMRIEFAVETMATWLVQAQTGFGARDAAGIYSILGGDRDDAIAKARQERLRNIEHRRLAAELQREGRRDDGSGGGDGGRSVGGG